MNKHLIFLGAVMLVVGFAPAGLAHLDNNDGNGSATSFGQGHAINPQPCRTGGAGTCTDHGGVSGTYYGAAGPTVEGVDPVNLGDLDGDGEDEVLFPDGRVATGQALCDLEILSDGQGPDDGDTPPLDETAIDGFTATGGSVTDGTWDDGGTGAACHTSIHYTFDEYNTPGCGDAPHETAYAEDWVAGGDVFIAASCDWAKYATAGDVENCAINEVLSGEYEAVVTNCVADFVNSLVDPSGGAGSFQECESAGAADGINYGEGGSGVPFPTVGDGCDPNTDADAAIIIWSAVNTDSSVAAAFGGWAESV